MSDQEQLGTTRNFDEEPDGSFRLIFADAQKVEPTVPEQIGRYRIERVLGRGGFGLVYLAFDDQLQRLVAIKVPNPERIASAKDAQEYLTEARNVARLDHPHIVPVFDVGSTELYPCFVVSRYIDGTDLAKKLKQSRLPLRESVELVATIAEAIHYAHKQGLVHRDIKPGNILLDSAGHPHLADFGLALREEQFGVESDKCCGSVHYMSPEQARGEGHLVDGRADIFSLGVVLYELLAGERPFQGGSQIEILRAVIRYDPRPLRQRNESIPRELERICLQALAKRVFERYSTAKDFAVELRQFLATSEPQVVPDGMPHASSGSDDRTPVLRANIESASAGSGTLRHDIVPKGLRAFDETDSRFFLSLVPGPHDRDGLPQSLRFWKSRIEECSRTNPLRVGVVYGPSGCGKSSLIRAGLLPHLSSNIRSVVVTATAHTTESQLLAELSTLLGQPLESRQRPPGLAESIHWLRRYSTAGRRILVVIDQFEQWLHANPTSAEAELVKALRQCDGENVVCLLIVRDDFWMSVHRLFRELDVRLAERENCAAVDLFDTRHAFRVLHAFGHAYGALPERTDQLSFDQREFLDRAIAELADDDRVICVRLVLFAQMIRNRPWTPETFQRIGGARGVGIRFLEDTFSAATAPMSYRVHRHALREMLRALLPASGTEIRACTRTATELARAAHCEIHSPDFRQMLEILEEQTRLLTPVDTPDDSVTEATAESSENGSARSGSLPEMRSYQLTHDYLVPSIREWLTHKQRTTWRGRCELQLEDRATLWSSRPERKQLPSLWETAQISLATNSGQWTVQQASMMRQAHRLHGIRLLITSVFAICAAGIFWSIQQRQQASLLARTLDSQFSQLMIAEIDNVPVILKELRPHVLSRADQLRQIADNPDPALAGDRLRAEMAIAMADPSRLSRLIRMLLSVDAETIRVVRNWLVTEVSAEPDEFWAIALEPKQSASARLRLAGLLAVLDSPENEAWMQIAPDVARGLVASTNGEIEAWVQLVIPVGPRLASALSEEYLSAFPSSMQRQSAAQSLSKLGTLDVLCLLIPEAEAAHLPLLAGPIADHREKAVERLLPLLSQPSGSTDTRDLLKHTRRQTTSAAALIMLGRDDLVWPLLQNSRDTSLRTELMLSLRSLGVTVESLLRAEESVRDPVARQAIWLALCGREETLPAEQIHLIASRLVARWPTTEHIAERSAMLWLAARCGKTDLLKLDTPSASTLERDWDVNSQGQVFAQFSGPVQFRMGSPDDEPRRDGNEALHQRVIGRSFAVSLHEVTIDQYRRFRPDYAPDPQVASGESSPANYVSWTEAAAYCRWLSEQEKVPEDQMCFPPVDQIHESMSLFPDLLNRSGYRLPTEAEWEYVCRGGTESKYLFGIHDEESVHFERFLINASEVTWPVGTLRPNTFGMFDVQGNVHEWCLDAFGEYPMTGTSVTSTLAETTGLSGTARICRGASYRSAWRMSRSAFRFQFLPTEKASTIGFRLAKTISVAR